MPSRRAPLPAGHASLTVVAMVVVCTTWSLGIARYGGPDEPGHILRAAAVADGQVLGPTIDGLVSGFRAVTVPAGIGTGDPKCFRHDGREPATCAHPDRSARGTVRVGSSAGTNPPWYYAAVGLPVRLLGDLGDASWYRVVAAIELALVLACAMARARSIGPRGPLVVLLAMTPVAWFLTGTVNPSAMEIALALVCWVGVERIRAGTRTTAELLWLGVPAGVAIAIRPIAAVAIGTMAVALWLGASTGRRAWAMLSIGPGAGALAAVIWARYSATEVRDARAALDGSRVHLLRLAVEGTRDTVHEIAGALGWLEFGVWWPFQWLWWAAVAAAGIGVVRRNGRRWRGVGTAWGAIALSALLFPIVFETALGDRLGPIWQGRYTIPTVSGLLVFGSTAWLARLRRGHVLVAASAVAVTEVATLWTALRRYAVGTDGSWWFTGAQWHPPVSPWLLLLANAAAMAGLMAVVLGATAHLGATVLDAPA